MLKDAMSWFSSWSQYDKLIKMVNCKLGNELWRWINQHDTSVGQRKNSESPTTGALSTELRELMESKVI